MASSPGHAQRSPTISNSLGRLHGARAAASTFDLSARLQGGNASTQGHGYAHGTRRLQPISTLHKFTQESRPSTPRDIYDLFPPHSPHSSSSDPSFSSSSIRPFWKRSLFLLLEQPTSSPSGTVPAFHYISGRTWFGMESALVALFTVEYVARCVAWSYSWGALFPLGPFFGIIDLLSVLPYYIELALHQDTSVLFRFSILRMFRLLRVFRPFRYNHTILLTIEVMYLSVRRSQHALLAIGFFVVMILTVFSTLLYFAERGTWDEVLDTFVNSDGDPTQFTSIPAAAWFVIVTITTVGYGEITPRSFLGRLVTLPILVFGLLLITLPSFVLGREFSLVWGALVEGQAMEQREGSAQASRSNSRSRARERRGAGERRGEGEGEEDEDELMGSARRAEREPDEDLPLPSSSYPPRSAPSSSFPPRFGPGGGTAGGGAYDPFLHQPPSASRDLSNMKLAQNQTELSRQIEELRHVVEGQGRMVQRLLEVLGEREKGEGKRARKRRESSEKGKDRDRDRWRAGEDGDADGES
ncbi:voltage-gated potassium channel [Coprinellus micaceus]|uniref:Voltage-gated potassium channel n=1 Tax=Coprinellus micaceus TaxID=71717 RepID=A0A4Y7T260_COPMI|nr:voltage-gated potassium channel [Coprinellus micaceus]